MDDYKILVADDVQCIADFLFRHILINITELLKRVPNSFNTLFGKKIDVYAYIE